MVANLVSSLYPNFACWWMLVVHWNTPDNAQAPMGRQVRTPSLPSELSTVDAVARTSLTSAPSLQQVVYTVTELVAAVTNYRMLDKRKPSNGPGLIMMGVVGTAHTLQSLADEALYNILLLRGALSPPPLPPPARTWPSG